MKPQAIGVYRNGHIELKGALNVPDGTEVVVTPSQDLPESISQRPHRPITRGMFAKRGTGLTEDDVKEMKGLWEREWERSWDRLENS